jgi:hypothetical protein
MVGFKPIVKMKTGGSVAKAVAAHEKKEMVAEEKGMHTDVKEDKKLIKKAVNLHDDQLHEGKKTDLSTLKKGGRCKKTGGTVRKYNCGGGVKKMADGSLTGALTGANQAAGVAANPVQNAAAAQLLKRKLMAQANQPGGLASAPSAPVGMGQAQNIAATPQNIGATTAPS